MDDGSCDDRIGDCDKQVTQVEAHKRHLEEELDERLKAALKNAKGEKLLAEANEKLGDTIKDVGSALEEALTEAIDKIEISKNEQDRINACKDARDKVGGKTKRFNEVKENFEEAERLLEDGESKTEAGDKAAQCDELVQSLKDTLEQRLNDALNAHEDADEMTDAELVAMYHAFTVELESMLEGEDVPDAGVSREKGVARSRLDQLQGQMKKMKAKEASLRKAMHKMIDDGLDAEGYP